jgi:hypothetical protein
MRCVRKWIANPRDSKTQKMNKVGQCICTSLIYSSLRLRGYRREAEIQKPSKLLYINKGVIQKIGIRRFGLCKFILLLYLSR